MQTPKKLRIIHTEASPHWGGQEIRIFEEMKWFREKGHEMILVAPHNGILYQRCKDAGFDVISANFTKPKMFFNIFKMLWEIWKLKPDVVATHSSTDSWVSLIASWSLGVKSRVRYRHVSTPVRNNFLNRLLYKKLCNHVVTTAECIKAELIKSFKLSSIITQPTPISKPKTLPKKHECRASILNELGISSDSVLVGQLSVIRSWKGHELLIKAFKILIKDNPRIHLLFIGSGPHYDVVLSTIKTARLEKNIHMLGHCEDIWRKLRSLDILILASTKNEAIPQSLIQGMLANVPIVAAKTGGIPEIIRHNETGFLFDVKNIEQICSIILTLLNDDKLVNRITKSAKTFIERNYNWTKAENSLLDIFCE
ncbi:MAG: glycosyltransferase family 4 protein [Verrucomicrobia bacterium]|nr:glycosyltransferase family 4 protein [Verrucomicrobiota bacterium]